MSRATLSVILPTHDRPELLRRALESVAAQTRPPDEVLVVDDGHSPLAPRDLPVDLPGLRWVRQDAPHGAARARNRGASLASGTWLAFLDDDDTWEPSYLAEAEELARAGDLELVLTAFLKVRLHADGSHDVTPEKVPPPTLRPEDFLVRNPGLRGSNLFISRECFLRVGGFEPSLPSFHDMDLGVRLAEVPGLRYAPNPQPRVRFHVHPGPRLSTAGSSSNVAGLRAFLARHGERMGPARVDAFRQRARELFGVEP